MKLQRLIQQVYYEPNLIHPDAHASIRRLLESRIGEIRIVEDEDEDEGRGRGDHRERAAQRTATVCGERVERPSMFVDDGGIAHIPIGGAIGQKLGNWAKAGGAVDVAEIGTDLDEAEENKKVKGIILDIDSPGGMVSGTPELADKIASVQKPCYAFSDGLIASAAYWLASACDGIFTTKAASSGSIGVYMVVYDESQAYQKEGIKVEVIKAGRLKGLGVPGTTLSEEGRAHLQERIDEIYGMFRGQVEAHRAGIAEESMQGQTFMAGAAFARGLIDGIVRDKAEMVRALF